MAQLTPSPTPHLVLQQLRRSYGHQAVIKDLNLQVARGQFLALLGPSGCGKTTTLRMIAGFEQPDAGHIHLDGRLLANASAQVAPEARGMGMVFQSYALWPHMRVGDNVGYALKLRGLRGADYRRAVTQALEQVELAEKIDAMPHALSGGQKQRVALARCIAAEPRVILLDEPLANLDRHLRRTMESAFRQLHRRSGATFIYVTHDQGEAMALADEIAVMHAGELVQRASPQKIYQQPRTTWLARFIGHGSVVRMETSVRHRGGGDGQRLHEPERIHAGIRHALPDSSQPQIDVLVRPEHVRVAPIGSTSAPHGGHSLPATLLDCVFKGERFELELALDLPGQQRLQAYGDAPLPAGTKLAVHIEQVWSLAAA